MNGRNLLGRVLALALIAGAVYGVREIARGGFACPLDRLSCCAMRIPARVSAPAAEARAAPAEKADAGEPGEDEDAKLEAKAPVVPPETPK